MLSKANKGDEQQPLVTVDPQPEALVEARRRWAELLRRIFEVDPLACPRCGEEMRIVAFITEPQQIDRILDHLRPEPLATGTDRGDLQLDVWASSPIYLSIGVLLPCWENLLL